MSSRFAQRLDASTVAPLVIQVRGCKAIKDADLAALFGISLSKFYDRIGAKLWILNSASFFKLPKRYDRGRLDRRPVLAFSQSGVLLVAGMLGDEASLEIGMDVAHAMKTKRRSSAHRKRPARRANDPDKTARYYEARARMMQGRLYDLLKKIRH